ncbi:MAG: hypothetical protein FJX72_02695 [Armatimonadetes bacterium]|nr:hypothetical protein [Armatimonadota bacterium]
MTWLMHTQPYMKNFQAFRCPSDSHAVEPWSGPMFSYVANGIIGGTCGAATWQWRFLGVINASRSWFEMTPRSMASVGLPAESIMFAERHKMPPGSWITVMHGAFSPWNSVLIGGDGADAGQSLPGQIQTGEGTWAAPDPNSDGAIATVHSGMGNFAFTDGHAKAMRPRTTVRANSQNNCGCIGPFFYMWDATRTPEPSNVVRLQEAFREQARRSACGLLHGLGAIRVPEEAAVRR